MAKSKATPGPWEVSSLDGRTIQHEAGAWAAVSHGEKTGDTIPRYQAVAVVKERTGETEANARLVAAAPDLLGAGEEALTLVSTMQGMPPSVDLIERVRETLENAIARTRPPQTYRCLGCGRQVEMAAGDEFPRDDERCSHEWELSK